MHVNTMDVRFKTPANFYICGQSQSGKSYLVRSMLRHAEELFNPVPTKIIYCYGIYQKEFEQMLRSTPNLTLVEGFPDNYLTQNLFPPGERSRTISLNSHVLVVFRNPRDSLGVSTLARQMFPKHTGYLLDAFHDATSRPYGYLVIDCHQLTPENMRLRTSILPEERQIVYVKRT